MKKQQIDFLIIKDNKNISTWCSIKEINNITVLVLRLLHIFQQSCQN